MGELYHVVGKIIGPAFARLAGPLSPAPEYSVWLKRVTILHGRMSTAAGVLRFQKPRWLTKVEASLLTVLLIISLSLKYKSDKLARYSIVWGK